MTIATCSLVPCHHFLLKNDLLAVYMPFSNFFFCLVRVCLHRAVATTGLCPFTRNRSASALRVRQASHCSLDVHAGCYYLYACCVPAITSSHALSAPLDLQFIMAHLITHHDPFHVHKILGVLALLHFLYRLFNVLTTGYAFTAWETQEGGRWAPLLAIALHGLLSWSSLLLPLTKKRILTAPMIWPEFRLHSIAFASRHVLGTAACLLGLWTVGSQQEQIDFGSVTSDTMLPAIVQRLYTLAVRSALVLGTSHAAGIITKHMGSAEDRTTNSMPYPPGTSAALGQQFKAFYATAQFHATTQAVAGDATMAFTPLFAIQGAPLLMTLVRKGKVGATLYHVVYTLTLLVPYVALLCRMLLHPQENALVWLVRAAAGRLAIELRIMRGMPQVVAWAGAMLALTVFECALEASGLALSGPVAFIVLGTWSVRAHIKTAVEGPTVANVVAATDDGCPEDCIEAEDGTDKRSSSPVAGGAAPSAEARRAAFAAGTVASNPFHMLGAMQKLWRLECQRRE